MPPSWCCTRLAVELDLDLPGATTAPDSGAAAIHSATRAITATSGITHASRMPAQLDACRVVGVRFDRAARRRMSGVMVFMRGHPSRRWRESATMRLASARRRAHARQHRRRWGRRLRARRCAARASLSSCASAAGRWLDQNHGDAARLQVGERVEQRDVAFVVEIRVRLVEHDEARIAVQRARERDALALAAGEHGAAIADLRVVAVRKSAGSSRGRARAAPPRTMRSEVAPAREPRDVFGDRAGEQLHVLRQVADVPAERVAIPARDVGAVEAHDAGLRAPRCRAAAG